MVKLKKKKTALEAKKTTIHSISFYFLPALAISLIVLLISALHAVHQSINQQDETLNEFTQTAAHCLSAQIQAVVQGKIDQVQALLAGRRLPDFSRIDERSLLRFERSLQRFLPQASGLAIVPADRWDEDKIQRKLFNSYAVTEMYQTVLNTGKPAPSEALKDAENRLHFIIAIPIRDKDQLVQAVMAVRFPFDLISHNLDKIELRSASIRLKQQGEMVLAQLGQSLNLAQEQSIISVPHTLWKIHYTLPERGADPIFNIENLILLLSLISFAVLFFVYRNISNRVQHDAQIALNLIAAVGTEKGAKSEIPQLKENEEPLKKLTELAQSQVLEVVKEKRSESKAGQVQIDASQLVEEEESATTLLIDGEQLPEHIFKAGVLRWYKDRSPDTEIIQAIGLALGTLVQKEGGKSVLIASDHLSDSKELANQLTTGILASGCDVIDLGVSPMPHLSFATYMTSVKSAIMVSAGHNVPMMQGIKIILNNQYLSADKTSQLRGMILDGHFLKGAGQLQSKDLSGEYIAAITNEIQLVDSFKIVLDCGNGSAGQLAERVFSALDCDIIPLYCDPDEDFLNHRPHPSIPINLQALSEAVKEHQADLGIALDNDGDAVAVIDEQGRPVPNDILLLLLANDIIRRNPGSDVIYDIACSATLPKQVLADGGRPIIAKSGASAMQAKLIESNALIAGEFSGHIYIQERWNGFDDGIYVAARLLEILSLEGMSLSEACEMIDHRLITSPRLELEVPEGNAEAILGFFKQYFDRSGADLIESDGLKVEYPDAWGLLRVSNVSSTLIFRFEGKTEEALERVEEKFRQTFKQFAPQLELPF